MLAVTTFQRGGFLLQGDYCDGRLTHFLFRYLYSPNSSFLVSIFVYIYPSMQPSRRDRSDKAVYAVISPAVSHPVFETEML